MKLSTRSRYGTRMMLDMAKHYDDGPIQIGHIAKRQNVSVKYLEQLMIPLKNANYVKSVRGPKGGYMLARPPEEITIAKIVELLEGGIHLADCVEAPHRCDRSNTCLTRELWKTATEALYNELSAVTLAGLIDGGETRGSKRGKKWVQRL